VGKSLWQIDSSQSIPWEILVPQRIGVLGRHGFLEKEESILPSPKNEVGIKERG
jgi:hypothetical protein